MHPFPSLESENQTLSTMNANRNDGEQSRIFPRSIFGHHFSSADNLPYEPTFEHKLQLDSDQQSSLKSILNVSQPGTPLKSSKRDSLQTQHSLFLNETDDRLGADRNMLTVRKSPIMNWVFRKEDKGASPDLNDSCTDFASPHPELLSIYVEESESEFTPNLNVEGLSALQYVFSCDQKSKAQNVDFKSYNFFDKVIDDSGNLVNEEIKKMPEKGTTVASVGCKCKKTMCLKLYCECFANGNGCGEGCACSNCLNNDKNPALRQIFIDELHGKGSAPSKKNSSGIGQLTEDQFQGCNCKKTGCSKKYCECFKYGLGCGPSCKCTDCLNISDRPENVTVRRNSKRLVKKNKKKSISFNNFVDKLKLFHILQNAQNPTNSTPEE
jgi:hypothetical protein